MSADAVPRGNWARISLTPATDRTTTAIIPTRNGAQRVAGLVRALSTDPAYDQLEVIVVDNGSDDGVTRPLLEDLASQDAIRVLDSPGPFNFSAINNRALAEVDTELVLFLNDDVMPADSRWLSQLVANFDDSQIAAAGPLLLFPDGSIQHAGVVVGLGGLAGHPFSGRRPDADGYFGWALARREVAAVTAACMLARTEQVRAIGGFDEDLPTDFGDVDLCLRLRALGRSIVIDPGAQLHHLQSASRGQRDADPDATRRFRAKWSSEQTMDPWYSPRLPTINPGYSL
jgi:GT2 family glycosyltransferase